MSDPFQEGQRFTFRMQGLACFALVKTTAANRNLLVGFGNRRQAQDVPLSGLCHNIAGKILEMHSLHDNENGVCFFVIEA